MKAILWVAILFVIVLFVFLVWIAYASYRTAQRSAFDLNQVCLYQPQNITQPTFQSRTQYDPHLAIWLADMIGRLYVYVCRSTGIDGTTKILLPFDVASGVALKAIYSAKVNRFRTEETFGSFVTLDSNPSIAFLAFRGTMTASDWIKDFSVSQKQIQTYNKTQPLANINVHQGFLSVYDSMRKQLHATLIRYRPSILYITGHSLGAAMCFVAAADLASSTFDDLSFLKSIRIYPFASPRPGNNDFATLLQDNYRTIVTECFHLANTADITVDVPLSVTPNLDLPWSPLIYTHINQYVPFTKNKGLVPLNHHFPTYMEALEEMFIQNLAPTQGK